MEIGEINLESECVSEDQIQHKEILIKCPSCPQSFAIERPTHFINHLQEFHAKSTTVGKDEEGKFHCPLCPKIFRTKDALHKHVINIHVEHKPFKCQICKSKNKCRNFVDQKSLEQHTTKIHGPPRFQCEICLTKFTDSSNFNRHRKTHLEVPESTCQHCSKTFSTNIGLKRHLVVKHRDTSLNWKTYTCELCGIIYISLFELERHIAYVHVVDKSVECDVCGKMFVDEGDLEHHVKIAHREKPKVLKCDVCSQVFSCRKGFVRHLGVKHGRFFDCPKCSRSFGTKTDFDQHSAVISDSAELQCHICQLVLPNQCTFNIHAKTHLGRIESKVKQVKVKEEKPPAGIKSPQNSKSKEKRFKCDLCLKTFGTPAYLVAHVKQVHPGFKWQCKVCEKTFKARYQLIRHERIHSLDRPWECQVCQKKFKSQGELSEHGRVHDEARRYKCLLCPKSFSKVLGLKLHRVNYHGGEKPFQCHLCDKSWAIKYHLEQHLILHSTERTFGCDKCSKTFKTSKHLKKHERSVHKKAIKQGTLDWDKKKIKLEVRTFSCNLCDFDTQDEKEIAKHNNNQHGIPRVLLSKMKSLSFPSY